MEGVVLYVALVRVFVKQQKKYILGFTAFSYGACVGGCLSQPHPISMPSTGAPALYMALVVPLGLALESGPHYGGDT